jgi:preprotein translocase subunit SecG
MLVLLLLLLLLLLQTIVGSEIFNQLVICAGAVFAAKSGSLQLDRAIVTREVFFYGLSIGLLLFALHDIEPSDDDEVGNDHIFISFSDACVLFGGYIVYVLVCANFEWVMRLVTCTKPPELISAGETTKVRRISPIAPSLITSEVY